tara:strand:- start:42 stop:551 length:510 start_codon:yes stop_codon:yes gene_type:complete
LSNFLINSYRFVAPETQYCQTNTNTDDGTVQPTSRIGTKFTSSATGAGMTITQATFSMNTDNTNSFNVHLRVYNLSNTLIGTIETKNNNTLPNSSFSDVVWSGTEVTIPSAGGYVVIEADSDAVRITATNGGGVSDSWFDDTNYVKYNSNTSTWSDIATYDATWCVTVK